MDINLPLILFLAVSSTGAVWLIDWLFFAKKRKQKIAQVDEQFAGLDGEAKEKDQAYLTAYEAAAKEPVVVEYSKSFFPILALVFVLRSFIVEPFQIPSESMVPTLHIGDFIAVNKFAYGIRLPVIRTKVIDTSEPERGDVVVFFPPHEDRYFIKRLIGLPGDTIRYTNNVLYINGEKMEQEFLHYDTGGKFEHSGCQGRYIIYKEYIGDDWHRARRCEVPGPYSRNGTWQVPEGHYFFMGDNRDNSADGRAWSKFVPDENIVGKAFAIWMHWRGGLPSFGRVGAIE